MAKIFLLVLTCLASTALAQTPIPTNSNTSISTSTPPTLAPTPNKPLPSAALADTNKPIPGALLADTNKPALVIPKSSDTRCFEMRAYTATPGKFNDLVGRFRTSVEKFYAKFGIELLGSFTPVDNPDGKIYMFLAFPSKEEQEKRYKAMTTDPEYQTMRQESDANGRLTARSENTFMAAADFTPPIQASKAAEERLFELRTYKCTTNNLPNLLARFRDHTVGLFQKHNLSQLAYWIPAPPTLGSDDTLIYLLGHKNKETAVECYKQFREDPDWIKAKADSEKAAGGSLTVTNGVQSVFLKPTDFSPMK